MGMLDEISQMRNQGMMDNEIANSLRQRGHYPKEINDALSQSQIKNAIAGQEDMQEMEPSIMEQDEITPPTPHTTNPPLYSQTQEVSDNYDEHYNDYSQGGYIPPNPNEYPPSSEQEYSPQTEYSEYPQSGTDIDTIIEIAEQVVSEKTKKIQNTTEKMNEFMTLTQTKIDNLSDRLKRMENIIDKLQIAILDKVGMFGKNLDIAKKEMAMMQDSFRKLATKKKSHHNSKN